MTMTENVLATTGVEAAIEELTALLPGQVLAPGDPGWDALSRGWILSVDQRPAAVVTVTDAEDVVAAVRCASRHGLAVAAQPVGHGATTALDGTVVLRTRALADIDVDVERRVARVGAGVKWGELLVVTARYGLTGLAGSTPDPSVVGFTLGGGLSWFGRAHGLAAHGVLAVDLVDAGGDLRRVTADTDPDLFWALRGGGGDFGIVTAMEIELHPAPHLWGGRLLWPVEMARPVLRAFAAVTAEAPDQLTLWANLLRFPPLPQVPAPLRGGAFVSVDVAFLGSATEGERLLAPLRSIPALWMDSLATVPLTELGGIAAEPVDPMPAMETSGLLHRLDDAAVDALVAAAGASSGCPLAVVQIRHLGGAFAQGRPQDGPAGAVAEPYQLFCLGVPVTPGLAAAVEGALSGVRAALGDCLSGRTMFNFLADDDDPGTAFDPAALQRLRAVKQATDPAGAIRSNRPVLRTSRC